MKNLLVGLVLFGFFSNANATVTTIGSLSYDSRYGNTVIKDSLNGYDWLRWDAIAGLTESALRPAIQPNGYLEGWSIAGLNEAQLFTDALVGSNPCTSTVKEERTLCSPSTGIDYKKLVGASEDDPDPLAFFRGETTNNLGDPVAGILSLNNDGSVYKDNFGISYPNAFKFSIGFEDKKNVSWLLYRPTSVPESGTIYLLGFGLLSLFGASRRKV